VNKSDFLLTGFTSVLTLSEFFLCTTKPWNDKALVNPSGHDVFLIAIYNTITSHCPLEIVNNTRESYEKYDFMEPSGG
jgi:hypothetical protein